MAEVLLVRSGDHPELIDDFRRGGYVAVGWSRLVDVSDGRSTQHDVTTAAHPTLRVVRELHEDRDTSSPCRVNGMTCSRE